MSQLPACYFQTPAGASLREHERRRAGFAPNGWWLCDDCSYRAQSGSLFRIGAVMSTTLHCAGCRKYRGVWFYERRGRHLIDARWWIVASRDDAGELRDAAVVQGEDKDAAVFAARVCLSSGTRSAQGPYRSDVIPERIPRYKRLDGDTIRALLDRSSSGG